MGLNRYYIPNLPSSGSIALPPDEAHHALRVRREAVGAPCVAFDGLGHVAICHIALVTKRDVLIEVESYRFEPNELPGRILLAVAMPKGDRQKAVIEKAVELGVHEIVPLVCQRSVCVPNEMAVEKWLRTVVEACKQCERNRLMSISQPQAFNSLIQSSSSSWLDTQESCLKLIAHPFSNSPTRVMESTGPKNITTARFSQVVIAIGPEGGFSNEEVQVAIDAGWRHIDFGPRILRVETAVCMASIYAGRYVGEEINIAQSKEE